MSPGSRPASVSASRLTEQSASPAHRCARGGLCADAEIDTESGRRRGAGTEAADTLCDGCGEKLRRALHVLPRIYVQLEEILDQHTRRHEKVAGSPDLPVPPRLDVLVLQADLDDTLSTWAEPVAEQLGVDWDTARMAGHRPGPRIQRAARLLALHVPLLLHLGPVDVVVRGADPAVTTRTGVEAALELLDLHQRARLLITGGSGDARLPVPCPSCEGVLIRRNGLDQVECQGCPCTWPETEYRRLCKVLAQDYRDIAA